MPLRTRPAPPDDLLAGGAHVLYEVQMLVNTAALLDEDQWGDGWKEHARYMAVVESFLTHARGLMFFLVPTASMQPNDIQAQDYCTETWTAEPWPEFEIERSRISREILHLSFARPPVGRDWPYSRMARDLSVMLSAFLERADRLPEPTRAAIRGVLDGNHVARAFFPTTTPTTALIDPSVVVQAYPPG